jgi:hypothetical protein
LRADQEAHHKQKELDREGFDKQQAQYQADLVRLDRQAASLDDRDRQLQARAREVDRRYEQLQQDSRELEEHARKLDECHDKQEHQAAWLTRQKGELDSAGADLTKRAAALEGQQAMLASLRTRLERMREDVRHEEQLLTEQRTRQEESEADLLRRLQEMQQMRAEFAADQQLREEESRRFDERRAATEAAVAQIEQLQTKVAAEEAQARVQAAALEARTAELDQRAAQFQARSAQVMDMQERLAAERQALRERETALGQAELAREALQEQLQRRAEELADRQRILLDRDKQHAEAAASLEAIRADLARDHQQLEDRLTARQQESEHRIAAAAQHEDELSLRQASFLRQVERLKENGRTLGMAKKRLCRQRSAWESDQQRAEMTAVHLRAEFDSLRHEAAALQHQMPHWEAQAQAAAEHLGRARDQLRGHLAELHAYARQAQEDLETLRSQVQIEAEKVRHDGVALHRARDEHRLAVTAFRQQLIDWQGQVAEMKQSLSQNETRLERRQAEVDATSARLARQAEHLVAQERAVTERRDAMERHLADMQEWYRRKLRELTERFYSDTDTAQASHLTAAAPILADDDPPAGAHGILALTDAVDPGDRKLGDLLRSLNLVDTDTLAALLVEARKQRQSLRQVLLASGYVTLYQLALIEAGNLDGLMLGPVRVVDRLRVSARETVYCVFDPRHCPDTPGTGDGYAVFRHLAEAEMNEPGHAAEFRERFAAAVRVAHPNLAATLEVLEIQERPAVLQEWVTGLPATDWPALFTVSGVWFRLLCQAALGLHTAHQAGLVHGHLHPALLILTGDGTLKIDGLGEPLWLASQEPLPAENQHIPVDPADDLVALGRLVQNWASGPGKRKGVKARPLAEPLLKILQRLGAPEPARRYASAAALLEDLDRVGSEVPPNPEAWDRLLRHGPQGQVLRQTA